MSGVPSGFLKRFAAKARSRLPAERDQPFSARISVHVQPCWHPETSLCGPLQQPHTATTHSTASASYSLSGAIVAPRDPRWHNPVC